MENNKIQLTVIIVSYNCPTYIKQCIESIRKYNDIGEALEIIVIDNSTNDETMKWLREEAKDVIAVPNDNKGFGQGNNVGASIAHGDILLFLNPDTILVEPIFKFAIKQFASKPSLGLFGVQLVDREGRRNSSYGFRMPLGLLRTLTCNMLVKLKVFLPGAMYTSGADIFIRKKDFQDAGRFDEKIFMYCEEPDLCNRINAIGKSIAFYPDKRIIHLEGKTQETKLYHVYQQQMKSRKYYCDKFGLDFYTYAAKEQRYCRLKSWIFKVRGNAERSEEYAKIVAYWNRELTGETEP